MNFNYTHSEFTQSSCSKWYCWVEQVFGVFHISFVVYAEIIKWQHQQRTNVKKKKKQHASDEMRKPWKNENSRWWRHVNCDKKTHIHKNTFTHLPYHLTSWCNEKIFMRAHKKECIRTNECIFRRKYKWNWILKHKNRHIRTLLLQSQLKHLITMYECQVILGMIIRLTEKTTKF